MKYCTCTTVSFNNGTRTRAPFECKVPRRCLYPVMPDVSRRPSRILQPFWHTPWSPCENPLYVLPPSSIATCTPPVGLLSPDTRSHFYPSLSHILPARPFSTKSCPPPLQHSLSSVLIDQQQVTMPPNTSISSWVRVWSSQPSFFHKLLATWFPSTRWRRVTLCARPRTLDVRPLFAVQSLPNIPP